MVVRYVLRALLFTVGAVCYALLNVLSQLSKEPDGSYAYSLPTVVQTAEFAKLCLSFGFLTSELGSFREAWRLVLSTSRKKWLLSAVPSVLYAINNNLDMLNNQYMDPATESVLGQLKILTTGLAWKLVFGKQLGVRKWLALALLCIGCIGAGWPTTAAANSMYCQPVGLVFIFFYVWISASAGVYNEWLYKDGSNETIHICNIRIYTVGVLFCLLTHIITQSGNKTNSLADFYKGYNVYTWGLVATYSVMGLLLAQVMKFFDSIVKLFISASSMYVSAVFTVALFERVPSMLFAGSLGIVTMALLLYNMERIMPLLAGTKKE